MRYLLNYMGRDRRYTEKVRNCQAFAADFFGFVAGKKGIAASGSWVWRLLKKGFSAFVDTSKHRARHYTQMDRTQNDSCGI